VRWADTHQSNGYQCAALKCTLLLLLLACRAYKEEEKKMGTLTNETIERPDSMTTAGECCCCCAGRAKMCRMNCSWLFAHLARARVLSIRHVAASPCYLTCCLTHVCLLLVLRPPSCTRRHSSRLL
jgi:hypothetical protein